jgi:hypothetical protein
MGEPANTATLVWAQYAHEPIQFTNFLRWLIMAEAFKKAAQVLVDVHDLQWEGRSQLASLVAPVQGWAKSIERLFAANIRFLSGLTVRKTLHKSERLEQ